LRKAGLSIIFPAKCNFPREAAMTMTPDEFQAILKRLDLNKAAAARAMGVHETSIGRYSTGLMNVPPHVEQALRNIVKMTESGLVPDSLKTARMKRGRRKANATAIESEAQDDNRMEASQPLHEEASPEAEKLEALTEYCARLEAAQSELAARAEKAEKGERAALTAVRQAYSAILKNDNETACSILAMALEGPSPPPGPVEAPFS
jgi:hypothetical protein